MRWKITVRSLTFYVFSLFSTTCLYCYVLWCSHTKSPRNEVLLPNLPGKHYFLGKLYDCPGKCHYPKKIRRDALRRCRKVTYIAKKHWLVNFHTTFPEKRRTPLFLRGEWMWTIILHVWCRFCEKLDFFCQTLNKSPGVWSTVPDNYALCLDTSWLCSFCLVPWLVQFILPCLMWSFWFPL